MITTDQAGTSAGFGLIADNPLSAGHPLNRDGDYVSAFGGTSSASPAVAGAVAVVLGVKPGTDVAGRETYPGGQPRVRSTPTVRRYARLSTERPMSRNTLGRPNAAGHDFHNWYGFGAVDVDAAVALAAGYAPGSLGTFVESPWHGSGAEAGLSLAIPDADGVGVSAAIEVTGLPRNRRR